MRFHQGGRLVHYTCASRMIEAVLVQNNQEGIWKESRPPEGRPEDSSIYIYTVYIYIYIQMFKGKSVEIVEHQENIKIVV